MIIIFSSSWASSQSTGDLPGNLNDSLFNLKLRLFINDYQFLDSAYTSAINELKLSDSALVVQAEVIDNDKQIFQRQESIINSLKLRIQELDKPGLAWWVYPAGGSLILIIGILTGLLIQ